MGCLFSAPLRILGSCFGSCVAVGCCKFAGAGEVCSERAARCVLVCLQVLTALLAFVASTTASTWLPGICGALGGMGLQGVGLCGCLGGADEVTCWSERLVYAIEAGGAVIFLALLLLAASGCAREASRTHAVAKGMAVVLISVGLALAPNEPLGTILDALVVVASAVFLVMQGMVVMDAGFSLNEWLYAKALDARRRNVSSGYRLWTVGILLLASALLAGTIAWHSYLAFAYSDAAARAVNFSALALSLALLLASIHERFQPPGSLLSGAVLALYGAWLTCGALAALRGGFSLAASRGLGLASCAVTLSLAAQRGETSPSGPGAAEPQASASQSDAEAGEAGVLPRGPPVADSGAEVAVDVAVSRAFASQCALHVAAALYIASALAPRTSEAAFAWRCAAVFVVPGLHAWALVAPRCLLHRSFG